MQVRPPLHLPSHTQAEGWLGSVTGCKQSPFSLFLHLVLYAATPRCSGLVTGAPEGQKPVAHWQLTADRKSQRPRCTQTPQPCTTSTSFSPLIACHLSRIFLVSLLLVLLLFSPFAFFLSSLLPPFFILKLLTQAVSLELDVPVSPCFLPELRAGSLCLGAKWFWLSLKPWRFRLKMQVAVLLGWWVDGLIERQEKCKVWC